MPLMMSPAITAMAGAAEGAGGTLPGFPSAGSVTKLLRSAHADVGPSTKPRSRLPFASLGHRAAGARARIPKPHPLPHCDRHAPQNSGGSRPVRCRAQLGDYRVRVDVRWAHTPGRPAGRHHRPQTHIHCRRRTVHHRFGAVQHRLERRHPSDCASSAGRGRGDRLTDRSGVDRDHIPEGSGTKRRHGGVWSHDGRRVGDGPGCGRRPGRIVLAIRVFGEPTYRRATLSQPGKAASPASVVAK